MFFKIHVQLLNFTINSFNLLSKLSSPKEEEKKIFLSARDRLEMQWEIYKLDPLTCYF